MALQRTSTLKMDQQNSKIVWGKLVPLSKGLSSFQLTDFTYSIGRNPQNQISIIDKRLSGKHCSIQKKEKEVFITDYSTNGTFIKGKKIGKNNSQQINDDQQIWLLPANKVNPNQTFGFKIQLIFERKQKQEKSKQEKSKQQELKLKEEQLKKQQQKKKQQKEKKGDDFAKSIKQQITCAFCFEVMFIPVSIQPCNHRFCGACLTQLVNSKKDACIQCRKQITTAVRDSIFNSIIEDYLKTHPEDKRDEKQQEQAKKKNIFGHDPIDVHEKIHGKKKQQQPVKSKAVRQIKPPVRARGRGLIRASSDLSASDDDQSQKCRECTTARNGFQCSDKQVHFSCHTCGKLVANREDVSLHQHCILCTVHFCNLYFPPCSKSGVKLQILKNRKSNVKIDAQLLRGNKFEFDVIKNYLLSKKQTSKDVFDYVIKLMEKDKFSYVFDKKLMKVPPVASKQVKMDSDSAVCDLCWKDLWFQMVFAYRTQITADLNLIVRNRPICYWGVNCRTMDHNEDHAKKYNHMVFQTRF